ncbi:hypothetical protein DPMN_006839 [Dreissena polymorpha]|uniref:Uncharacterized protein n=1 Tax=Dreissena polymorpha TaxID=45954 RepID=A0A9D4MV11_DREPO|nr:hypothetical protein DPMN_006837 [Dreissena polymorpha]KAH3882893.1 hypothetical protein DPMN_006839 [Dreissena polymorpha]
MKILKHTEILMVNNTVINDRGSFTGHRCKVIRNGISTVQNAHIAVYKELNKNVFVIVSLIIYNISLYNIIYSNNKVIFGSTTTIKISTDKQFANALKVIHSCQNGIEESINVNLSGGVFWWQIANTRN